MESDVRRAHLGVRKLLRACLVGVPLLAGCTQPPKSCPGTTPIGLDRMAAITTDHDLPFRFPRMPPAPTTERTSLVRRRSEAGEDRRYHAAETSVARPGRPYTPRPMAR